MTSEYLSHRTTAKVTRADKQLKGRGHRDIKLKSRLASGLAAVALQFLIAGTASAHHPEIAAVAVCDENNEPVIECTATA